MARPDRTIVPQVARALGDEWRNSLMRTAAFLRGEPSKSGAGSRRKASAITRALSLLEARRNKVVTMRSIWTSLAENRTGSCNLGTHD